MENDKTKNSDSQDIPKENKPKQEKAISLLRSFAEFVLSLFFIIIAANLIHKFIFHPFYVIGESMQPSFQNGNYLFVEKLNYRFNDPQRGDVVVFIPSWDKQNQYVEARKKELGFFVFQLMKWKAKIQRIFGVPVDSLEIREYIKRIVGLPGDTVIINKLSQVTIKNEKNPNGIVLDENYITPPTKGELEITLGDGEYFVLGDNRPNSSDSRGNNLQGQTDPHVVTRESIEGKVFVRLWPLNQTGIIHNPSYEL